MSEVKDYLKLHFIVLIWGFTAILGLLIRIPPVELVFFRTLLAFTGLGLILYVKNIKLRITLNELLIILSTGALLAAHWILFFAAARVSTASVTLAGIATLSLWTSFLEPLMNRRKIKWYEVMLGLVVLLGLYVIFRFEFNHALGLIIAIVSAFLGSVFTVINGKLTHRHNPYVITFYEMVGAFLGTTLFFPFYLLLFNRESLELAPVVMDWVYLSILAFICTIYVYSVSIELMQRISAFSINLVVNLEIIYGIVLAVIIFGEREKMTFGFYMGTLIILSAVFAHPFLNKYFNRKPLEIDNLR
jgi:drug/metabolite transporter (DMT)-like permease